MSRSAWQRRCTATGLTAATDTLRTNDAIKRAQSFCISQDQHSLPRGIPIGRATLHELTRDSAHKAEDNLQALEEGFEASTRPFYENPDQKRRGVSAVG